MPPHTTVCGQLPCCTADRRSFERVGQAGRDPLGSIDETDSGCLSHRVDHFSKTPVKRQPVSAHMISPGSVFQRLDPLPRLPENPEVSWLCWSGEVMQWHQSHPADSEFWCHVVELFVNEQASADDLSDRFNRFYADKFLVQS